MDRLKIKKDRGSSLRAFFVSITFCFVALFYAIPNLGVVGIIWGMAAALLAIMNGINALRRGVVPSKKAVQAKEKQIKEQTPDEILCNLNCLYEQGQISATEYRGKRAEILKKI